jgi:MarR family transcriptional regulator, 2-MHQ and catechol-resistance regulon repressor
MGTHYQGTKKEVGALNAYIKLIRASESLNARVHRHLSDYSVSSSQFAVMEILHHLGPLCQRDLGCKMLRTGGNVVMIIDNLEKRGLVKRDREGKDRRYVNIRLTAKGKRLIQKIFPEHVVGIVKEMNILNMEEQLELESLCRKLGLQEKKS